MNVKTYVVNVRIRYSETDKMGVVYHGNYAQYLEIARVEWLRSLGISYKWMEESGVMLPVTELKLKFLKPSYYDDVLSIKITLLKRPFVRIEFDYEIHNQNKELICTANTVLAFINTASGKPIRCPSYLLEKFENLEF
ncbi:YbgC/FadM family acyl-CoA thioesterase [Ascidiimonas sp. W6]|uniref:acyl-CoA thioesterase n=1 Tax=Ascidiimonas meishanensis TaxID=3128903 RepID=UPI0030ED3092